MFCPACGTQSATPEQRFCKACGTNLVVVSQALSSTALDPAFTPGVAPALPPPQPFQPPHGYAYLNPVPLAEVPGLPFMKEEAQRRKVSKVGWAMLLGGPLLIPILAILKEIANVHGGPEFEVIGVPIMLVGLFLVLYARFILKPPKSPQVIVVQSPTPLPTGLATGQLSQPAQLPPQPVSLFSQPLPQPFSVTENTTDRLSVPIQPRQRNTQ